MADSGVLLPSIVFSVAVYVANIANAIDLWLDKFHACKTKMKGTDNMRNLLFGFVFLTFSNFAIADHHALNLEARQARSEADITSIQLGEDISIITAEGTSGEYGKGYITYHLTYNRDGSGGSFTMEGRGYVDVNTIFSGSGAGKWVRDGHLVKLTGVTTVSDGSQNLDVIVVDPLNRTMIIDSYILVD